MILSKNTIDMIIGFEVTSEAWYNKKFTHPTWPGGHSGVTIGIGYDLGMNRSEQIVRDWTGEVNLNSVALLANLGGITGEAAKSKIVGLVREITIPYESAYNVFINSTLPRFCKLALNTYPGLDLLNPDTQGAIVSLVYNRGTKLNGERRIEMNNLVGLIALKDYTGISNEIKAMTRLWVGKGLPGLIQRRMDESAVVSQSVNSDLAVQNDGAVSFSV